MNDKLLNELLRKAEAEMPALMERGLKKLYRHEFADFDCSSLPKMTDKELAAWQAQFPIDSTQYVIAVQEWNRRSLMEQTKWMKRSIYIGFLGIIIGAILTAFVTWLLPPQQSDNKISPQNQATENRTQQNTEEKNTDIKATIRQNK